ncbi:MAG: segregation/condensation protein A [Bdellovibrionaceae bacterium]|nr:segregation/condensation protein A [Pseudobdellovibrionaceae bacterium]
MSVVVQLSKFEGPLALLLYLIRKDEMDIFDIKINEITTQYLDYIKLMKELDLEMAGEFVAMAATLIQIKSKMLLPQYDEKGEIIETEDPRKELVQKLLEYQKYQEAARLLYERPLVGRDMWTRGVRLNLDEPTEEIEVEENGLFQMISLYRQIMRSAKKRIHQVTAKAQSIASRILEIKDLLTMGSRKTLNELIGETENRMRQVLITFLSVLELAKLGFVGLYQTETYGDLWIDLKKPIEKDVVSAVEEYGSIDSKADSLFEKAAADAAAEITGTNEGEEFVLVDSEDRAEEDESMQLSLEDMASDDDILQAERELAGEIVEPLAEIETTEPIVAFSETSIEADLGEESVEITDSAWTTVDTAGQSVIEDEITGSNDDIPLAEAEIASSEAKPGGEPEAQI